MSIAIVGRRSVVAAVIISILAAGASLSSAGAGAQDGTSGDLLIKVTAPVEAVSKGDENIIVTITAENAKNLGAFGFQLEYDPNILEIAVDEATQQPLVQKGDFLGSSGREVACPDPESQPGVLRMLCTSLRLEPAGPDGSGTLATVTFRAIGSGTTALTLDKVQANNPDATEISPIQIQSATLDVQGGGGMNWLLWGIILGVIVVVVVGVGAFAATKMRGSSTSPPAPAA